MIRVYLVQQNVADHDWTKRVSIYHASVFNGVFHYVGRGQPGWRPPATTNSNREPAHISRSGRYVPPVFGDAIFDLVISATVRKRLAGLPNVEFNPVVFERLVDVPMPALGDFTWANQDFDTSAPDFESRQVNPDYEITTLPDVPEFHRTIGPYYSLLTPNLYEVEQHYDDVIEVTPQWGNYHESSDEPDPVKLSEKLLGQSPIIRSRGAFAFREDAFERIAPFLDLDYYAVAIAHVGEPEPSPHVDALLKRLEEEIESDEEDRR